MAARALPRPVNADRIRHTLKPMVATWRLAALFGVIVSIAGIGFSWKRIKADSTSQSSLVDEIYRPSLSNAIPCNFSVEPRPLMILVLGQSNAGNHGSEIPSPEGTMKASFLFEGRCYPAAGPAPGATGRSGNIWTALAPRLARATGRPVVFSVLAVEASELRQWVEPGKLERRLVETLIANREHAFVPDVVLWQQGEADARAGTTASEYQARFSRLVALLRNQGVTAPVIAALSTRCRNDGSEQVRTALRESANLDSTLRLGPDTDALTGPFRHDGCHFSISGLEAAAELWLPVIMADR